MTTLIYSTIALAAILLTSAALYYRAARQRAALKLAGVRNSSFPGRRS